MAPARDTTAAPVRHAETGAGRRPEARGALGLPPGAVPVGRLRLTTSPCYRPPGGSTSDRKDLVTEQVQNDERRTFRRMQAHVSVRPVSILARAVPRRVGDMSLGGLRCYSDDEYQPGKRLELELFFLDGRSAIVLAEVVIGLMLFSGTFSFLASIGSALLLAMFTLSTGMYSTTWWMVFATILTAGGLGRAFGLDHWILPYSANVLDAHRKNGKWRFWFGKDTFR